MANNMAVTASFRFLDLPAELRYRVYDFLNLVAEDTLSIFEISQLPEVIQRAPDVTQQDMLDVFLGQNRFSITCLMGLPDFLAVEARPYISRIQRLHLGHGIIPRPRVTPTTPISERFCELDVNLVSAEPGFTVRLTHGCFHDQDKVSKVLAVLEGTLSAMSSRSKARPFRFDAESLKDLAEHWLCCRR